MVNGTYIMFLSNKVNMHSATWLCVPKQSHYNSHNTCTYLRYVQLFSCVCVLCKESSRWCHRYLIEDFILVDKMSITIILSNMNIDIYMMCWSARNITTILEIDFISLLRYTFNLISRTHSGWFSLPKKGLGSFMTYNVFIKHGKSYQSKEEEKCHVMEFSSFW